MFGRKRRADTELLELVRRELEAVRTEVQTALADTAAGLTTRVRTEIDQRVGEPRALVAGLADVRESLAARETEIAQMLRQVAETCAALAERIQLDRVERTVLADAVNRLAAALSMAGTLPVPALRPTVLGGTVDPEMGEPTITEPVVAQAVVEEAVVEELGPVVEIDLEAEAAIDAHAAATTGFEDTPAIDAFEATDSLRAAPHELPRDGVEVRCRFGDRWVTGFEVCEVIRFDDVTRYRLRRRSDGSILPTLFEDRDVRFFSTFAEPRQ